MQKIIFYYWKNLKIPKVLNSELVAIELKQLRNFDCIISVIVRLITRQIQWFLYQLLYKSARDISDWWSGGRVWFGTSNWREITKQLIDHQVINPFSKILQPPVETHSRNIGPTSDLSFENF